MNKYRYSGHIFNNKSGTAGMRNQFRVGHPHRMLPTPESSEQISPTPISEKAEPVPQPEHRIGVRVVNGAGEFYDRLSGEKFIPRGNNHISLDPIAKKGRGAGYSFFDVQSRYL